jgi:hypothetical protein
LVKAIRDVKVIWSGRSDLSPDLPRPRQIPAAAENASLNVLRFRIAATALEAWIPIGAGGLSIPKINDVEESFEGELSSDEGWTRDLESHVSGRLGIGTLSGDALPKLARNRGDCCVLSQAEKHNWNPGSRLRGRGSCCPFVALSQV